MDTSSKRDQRSYHRTCCNNGRLRIERKTNNLVLMSVESVQTLPSVCIPNLIRSKINLDNLDYQESIIKITRQLLLNDYITFAVLSNEPVTTLSLLICKRKVINKKLLVKKIKKLYAENVFYPNGLLKAMQQTTFLCPSRVNFSSPVSVSQILQVLSQDPVMNLMDLKKISYSFLVLQQFLRFIYLSPFLLKAQFVSGRTCALSVLYSEKCQFFFDSIFSISSSQQNSRNTF